MKIFLINRARFITCLFFLSFSAHAKIIKDEVTVIEEKLFSYREVCKKLTKRDSPLMSYHSISKLDCMGDIINVGDFCDKQTQEDPYYVRAIINKKSQKVVCKSATRVRIKYECESKSDKFCEDKEIGCYLFQEKLAKRLKTAHSSLISSGKKRILNCHFTPKSEPKVNGQN